MEAVTVSVRAEGDIGHARRTAVSFAGELGFAPMAVEQIAIAVTELATNLVRHHTIDGQVVIREAAETGKAGIEVVAEDRGPGIAALHLATSDHWSTRGPSGCGLGAVRRLMDTFDIQSEASSGAGAPGAPAPGTRVTTRKWNRQGERPGRFNFSANSRPYPGESENGDAYFVHEDEKGLLVVLADGLGHGPKAAKASRMAMDLIRENAEGELETLLRDLHQRLASTRGVAITLARINLSEKQFYHIGVGNVSTRVYPAGSSQLVTLPGVIGMGELGHPRLNRMAWPEDGTLVVFSDGISAKWDPSDKAIAWDESVTVISRNLLQTYGRSNDDATVLVVREAIA